MKKKEKTSILTNTQREWLRDESVTHENKVRGRVQQRLRAAIATDSELVAKAFEDGDLKPDTVGKGLDFAELGDGISALVAVLYCIADESGLSAERTIQKGIKQGKEGRINRIERKLENDGAKSLTLGELMDLREESPERAERLNRALDQDMSDLQHGFVGDEGIDGLEED